MQKLTNLLRPKSTSVRTRVVRVRPNPSKQFLVTQLTPEVRERTKSCTFSKVLEVCEV